MTAAGTGGPRPFDGIRVLDVTTATAGAVASMHIADFGGDVVAVEPAGHGRLPADPLSLYAGRNKRVTSFDSFSGDGLAHLRRLVQRADVLVVDGPSAVLDRYGLDATTLCTANSRLVHLWMPAYAAVGRGGSLPADDLLLAARSGVADQQPATVDRPVAPVVPHFTYVQGLLGAIAIAGGLLARQRTGIGRAVTVSGLHAVAALGSSFMGDLPGTVRAFAGPKARPDGMPSNRMYQCGDGLWLFVACMTPAFFAKALDVMGMQHVMELPGVGGGIGSHWDPEVQRQVSGLLEARMRERERAVWLEMLEQAGVPVVPVEHREEWLRSETVAANEGLVTVGHSELGPVVLPGIAVELTVTPGRVTALSDRKAVIGSAQVWADAPELPARTRGQPSVATTLPLTGIRVLDLGAFLAGPLVSDILGDMGASVVKVETPSGDGYRISAMAYAAMNKGKRNVSIDLKDPLALDLLLRLVRESDVLVDNARSGVPERLGTYYEALRRVNPTIVRCTVTGWGEGPLKETPCFDPLLQARGGLMVAQGGDGDPVLHAIPVHDVGTGTLAAFGAVAALFARPSTGRGQEVRTSLTLTSLMLQAGEVTTFDGSPPPARGGADHLGPSSCRRLYQCRDGWIAVSAEPLGPGALLSALAPTAGSVGEPGDEIERRLATTTVEEALDVLTASSVPAVKVPGRDDVFDDPWLRENHFVSVVEDADHGRLLILGGFAEWGCPPAEERSRSHGRGEDTRTILREAGFTDGAVHHWT